MDTKCPYLSASLPSLFIAHLRHVRKGIRVVYSLISSEWDASAEYPAMHCKFPCKPMELAWRHVTSKMAEGHWWLREALLSYLKARGLEHALIYEESMSKTL